jgi:hypothetical protein
MTMMKKKMKLKAAESILFLILVSSLVEDKLH